MQPTDRRPRTAWWAVAITAVPIAALAAWLVLPRGSSRLSLAPAASDTVPVSATAATAATSAPSTSASSTIAPAATVATSAAPAPVPPHAGSAGGGLPSTNTYPYHSTGVDWAGLNTTDPRCAPILRNQRVLELPNFVGKTLQQAAAALDPIGMYSYCTNGTIIMVQFVREPDVCTNNEALNNHIAAQSPAPGTRVSPAFFPVHLTYYFGACPPTTTVPPLSTTAPPTT